MCLNFGCNLGRANECFVQLGGHYIAYTALPPAHPSRSQSVPSSPDPNNSAPVTSDHHSEELHPDSAKESKGSQPPRQWAYISDTVVRLTTLEEVLKAKAYICMYERV